MKLYCQQHQAEVEGVQMALLDGGQMQRYFECPLCLKSRMDVLCAENVKLRSQRDTLSELYASAVVDLREANARLRALGQLP